jgi:pimeloyl-ACP methyl ester carboxylesterase
MAQESAPSFEGVSCDTFNLSEAAPDAVEGQDMVCGYLTVPENRLNPTGKTIQLGVVIIKSTGPNPAEPLVMTQGGPGGSGIELYSSLASPTNELGQMLRLDRDLIAFEQRGTLYAKPFLTCPELLETELEHIEQDLEPEEELKLTEAAYQACIQRLENEGVDLAAFNSWENADDIADLALALGYDQINYYGVSYGTQLGEHLMKRHPDLLRSVILDGVVSLELNPNQRISWSKSRSFREVFQACQADPDCNKHFPDLENVFFDTVESLNQNPARVPLTDPQTDITYQSVFNGDDLESLVTQLLYMTPAIPVIPKLIYDAHEGVFRVPEKLLSFLEFDRTMGDAMYMTVMCAEDFDFTVDELDTTDAYPKFITDEQVDTDLILKVCANFNVPELGAEADEPVVDDIPTLLYSGFFDPVTPYPYAEQVAKGLDVSYAYVFPVNGHGAFLEGTCSTLVMRDFLNDPNTEPDAGCVQTENPVLVFYTPSNTLMSPAATHLIDMFNEITGSVVSGSDNIGQEIVASLKPLLLPVQLLWLLLIFPLVWFVSWMVNRLRKVPGESSRTARFAPWLGTLVAVVAFGFAVSQIIEAGAVALGGGIQAWVGVSRSFAWIYVIPWVLAVLVLAMLILAVLACAKGFWGWPRRLYYSFTVLVALYFIFLLAKFGIMTVLF